MGTLATITATGVTASDFILSSDRRLKSNIAVMQDALTKLLTIRGVTYEMKGRTEVGVIAQDVQVVLPEAVHEGEDGMLGVAYERLIPLLIESIRTLTEQVAALQLRVA
jgi:hypothetical protein